MSALAIRQSLGLRSRLRSRALLRCESYDKAYQVIWKDLKLLAPAGRGKSVPRKPTLVE
jgi:hypothetical protein